MTACPDWERRIVAGESLIPRPPPFPEEAARAWETFGAWRVADVRGKPRMAEISRPWVRDFVGAIFGAYDAAAGRQMVREALLLVAKKNSKSTLAAGVMMTALTLNERGSAEFLILAPTKEIAGNSFDPAADMADAANEELAEAGHGALFRVYRREKRVVHLGTGASLKVIAADADTVGGTKATAVLVDELWLFGKQAGAMSMLREAVGGLAARPEGFVVYLSTMSDEPPAGEFRAKLIYAREVRDGRVDDPAFLPVLYEWPERMLRDKAHREPANFRVVNPNLGASVDEAFLLREWAKAERAGEGALRDFEAKHLNVEVGLALRSDRWAGADHWEAAAEPGGFGLDALLARCDVATVGVDGGGLDDLLGVAVLGRERHTRRWLLWVRAWAHPIVLERRKGEATKLREFAASGDLVICPALGDDVRGVADVVERVRAAGILGGVGLDPVGIGDIVDELALRGIGGEVETAQGKAPLVQGIPQGWRLSAAIKTLERALAAGTCRHAGQPLMAWCVGNAKAEPRGNAVSVTKAAAGSAKIDPLVAAFDAAELMGRDPRPLAPSYLESGEMAVL